MLKKGWERIKHHFLEVIRIKKTPHEIALGFAVGTLIDILPTFGINILLAFLAILLYKKLNKIAVFGALIFWNPFFTVPIHAYAFKLGGSLFSASQTEIFNTASLDNAYNFSRNYLIVITAFAFGLALTSYGIIWLIATIIQKRGLRANAEI